MAVVEQSVSTLLPRHVAIIMDGNGRWAKKQKKSRLTGHKRGFEVVRQIVAACAKREIEVLSLFTFSSENWARPEQEVNALLKLLSWALSREINQLHEAGIRVRFIGDRSRFNAELVDLMTNAEIKTAENQGMTLVLAVNYGGRWDIQQAVKTCLSAQIDPEHLSEEQFSQYLSLADLPAPDLFIRTSGEQRISNFFLWQLAYTELYFVETYWPDFQESHLDDALRCYAKRQRRFGKTSEQLDGQHV